MSAPVTVTFFTDQYASTKREARLTPEHLAELIRNANAAAKARLPWLKLAMFGNQPSDKNCLRHDDNIIAITGIEGDYDGKGVCPIDVDEAVQTLRTAGIAAIIYTSPSHTADAPRLRVLCFLSREHAPTERDRFMARLNGLFDGIFAAESWPLSQGFYFGSVAGNPSHRVVVIEGDFIDLAHHLEAGAILPENQDAQTKLREQRAQAPSPALRAEPGGSLIEKIRSRLDLDAVLASHGYARRGDVWRHPNSQSGSFGLNIKTFSSIERVYSHNGGDPLHPGNLPAWTAGVTAIDVVDVVAILDFGEDRTRALRELALRFGLSDGRPPFRRLWDETVPLCGTLAATWLEAIGLGHLTACPELRFAAYCPHPRGVRLPAVAAAVRAPDGELTAIHRIYLRADGSGLADIDPPRAALGKVQGGAVRLADVGLADELVIGTDLVEVAALAQLLNLPGWCAADVKNLAGRNGIGLPPEVRSVGIIATEGDNAARPAFYRFRREGRAVQTFTPPDGARSYIEMLNNKNAGRNAA
jgi:hypothetical protein